MNSYMIWLFLIILLFFPLCELNAIAGSEIKEIQHQAVNNKSVSTLDSIKSIIEESQNSGVLGRLAKCGATMQNMTEDQHQCVDNLAMGIEGLK